MKTMCGITGYWDFRHQTPESQLLANLHAMSQAIIERGPDSSGLWCDPSVGLGLGHRRLAIVDLSEAGHQPMMSHSGRFVMIYNGEVYNTAELRTQLGQAP